MLGALTYTALYLLKSYIKLRFTTADVDPAAIQVTMLSKATSSLFNAAFAFIVAPIFFNVLRKPLRRLGLYSKVKPVLPIGFFWPASKAGLFCDRHRLLFAASQTGSRMRPGPICAWRSSLARHGFSGFSPRQNQIGEFFVLIRRIATLERLMQPRPLHADGKVAPVIPRHRAGCASFRTRRGDICSPPGSALPERRADCEPLRRARLDEHEHLFARIPEFPGHMQPHRSFRSPSI